MGGQPGEVGVFWAYRAASAELDSLSSARPWIRVSRLGFTAPCPLPGDSLLKLSPLPELGAVLCCLPIPSPMIRKRITGTNGASGIF